MTIGYNIPLDLIFEILSRLPGKSVWRFRSVSKSWRAIISSQQFIEAFMYLSFTRPRLVIASYDSNDERMLFNFSPHQSGSLLSSSSMLVAEKNTLTMPKVNSYYYNHRSYFINSVRGFVCCCLGNQFVVCNPTTGQVIPLSEKNNDDNYICSMFLGYDSNSDQYKVLRLISLQFSNSRVEYSVRTLGGKGSSNSWRPIKTNITYYVWFPTGVCIDGVVYYQYENHHNTVLSSFDVGSEQLRLITTPENLSGVLTNYLEKLAVYRFRDYGCRLWVLDDVKNQIWSKKICIFQSFTRSMFYNFRFGEVTSSGEIVYVPSHYVARCDSDSLELLCHDVEKKIERKVNVEGLAKIGRFHPPFILCSYVENIIYL